MADDDTTDETPEVDPPEPAEVPEVEITPEAVTPVKKRRKVRLTAAEKRGEEVEARVEDYPERPYLDAITPEHRAVLEAAGQLPKA